MTFRQHKCGSNKSALEIKTENHVNQKCYAKKMWLLFLLWHVNLFFYRLFDNAFYNYLLRLNQTKTKFKQVQSYTDTKMIVIYCERKFKKHSACLQNLPQNNH